VNKNLEFAALKVNDVFKGFSLIVHLYLPALNVVVSIGNVWTQGLTISAELMVTTTELGIVNLSAVMSIEPETEIESVAVLFPAITVHLFTLTSPVVTGGGVVIETTQLAVLVVQPLEPAVFVALT
jgi:hypothetical protein